MRFLMVVPLLLAAQAGAAGLAVDSGNPRFLRYHGKSIVLLGATEHYGSVVNADFDFLPYLDALAANHLNLARVFCFYREQRDSLPPLGYQNTLAPRPGHEVLPWLRAGPDKAPDGGLKFDLSRWNPRYFSRIKRFLTEAGRRGIVVEVVFFCNPYNKNTWSWFPFEKNNNINGAGRAITEPEQFMEQHDPVAFEFQRQFVRKLVQELNAFDNVYFEICNETSIRSKARAAAERQVKWELALAREVHDAGEPVDARRLVAVNAHQQIPAYSDGGRNFVDTGDTLYFGNPLIDIVNYHYMSRMAPGRELTVVDSNLEQAGNIWAFLAARRHVRTPIVFDENNAGVVHGRKALWNRNRMEAWETIIGGASGYNHLDWSFTTTDPTGSGRMPLPDGRRLDGRKFRAQLGLLSELWRESGPDRMQPDSDLVTAAPSDTLAFASSRTDKSLLVVYIADRRATSGGFGSPLGGAVTLRLPAGDYGVRTVHSGGTEWTAVGQHSAREGRLRVVLPGFTEDCAVVLTRH